MIKKSSVKKATIFAQLAMLTNILVGLVVFPLLNKNWGEENLVFYIKILAIKFTFDTFTSAFGGSFIRLMIDNNTKKVFGISFKVFAAYSLLASFVYVLYVLMGANSFTFGHMCFVLFLMLSFLQQPFLQKYTALGYQHIPAISRIIFNLTLFIFICSFPFFCRELGEREITITMLFAAIASSSFTLILHLILPRGNSENLNETIKLSTIFDRNFIFYAIFASCFAFSFQLEALLLDSLLSSTVFIAIIVGFKVPNILVQFIWRFCEIYAVSLKRGRATNGKSNSNKIKVYEYRLFLISIISSIAYFLFANLGYSLWMGDEFVVKLPNTLVLTFTLLIPIFCMGRFYTSFLQYTNSISILSTQYISLCIIKALLIIFAHNFNPLISFYAWGVLELIFILINRRRFLLELQK